MSIMLLIVANVVARFFGRPLNGTSEWVGFLMSSAIALALSYCAAQEGHVAVTIFVEKLSKRKQAVVEIIVDILILIFLIYLVRMLILYADRLLTGGIVGLTTKIPLHYFAYIIAMGFFGYCLVLVGEIGDLFKKEGKRWISF
jgi:TRAP-type C4-dicarboxylate transport system permease small subunit